MQSPAQAATRLTLDPETLHHEIHVLLHGFGVLGHTEIIYSDVKLCSGCTARAVQLAQCVNPKP